MLNRLKVRRVQGFTLIELLVALAIFVVLSALSYRSLVALLQTRERIAVETTKWREVMLFFNRLDVDLRQLVNRPIRIDQTSQASFLAKQNLQSINDAQLSFSRVGSEMQTGYLMDTQRIGYRMKAGNIEMLVWPALDLESRAKPAVYTVLSGVKSMTLRYKPDQAKPWVETWPNKLAEDIAIPKALEMNVTLTTGETLQRIYLLQ